MRKYQGFLTGMLFTTLISAFSLTAYAGENKPIEGINTLNYPITLSEEYIGDGEWHQMQVSDIEYDENFQMKETFRTVWKYVDDSGVLAVGWKFINNNWYYFDEAGIMKSSAWVLDNLGNWHYFNADGDMAMNQWIDGKYYVDQDGTMLKNTYAPDGRYLGEDGGVCEPPVEANDSVYTLDYSALSEMDWMSIISGNNAHNKSSNNSEKSSDKVYSYVHHSALDEEAEEIDESEEDMDDEDEDTESGEIPEVSKEDFLHNIGISGPAKEGSAPSSASEKNGIYAGKGQVYKYSASPVSGSISEDDFDKWSKESDDSDDEDDEDRDYESDED